MTAQPLTPDRLAATIAEFERLGLDLAKLRKLIDDRDELARRLATNRAELLALRPSDKGRNYEQETARLTQVTGALAAQIDGAREDVAREVLSLQYKAATELDLSELVRKANEIDSEWVRLQVRAADLLQARHEVTMEYNELADIASRYARELRLDEHPRMLTPWRATWPQWSGVIREYLTRFLRMIEGNRPEPGHELEWFARKFW